MSDLGRISGKLLQSNLRRNGNDLSFRNGPLDNDLLYLDVNNIKIGINTDTPSFDLTVSNWTSDSLLKTTNLKVTGQAIIDDFIIYANNITSQTNPIDITMTGNDPVAYFDRLSSNGAVIFDDNKILGNGIDNIEFDPNQTGTVELLSTTNVDGDVNVTGNIDLDGNLSTSGNIIIGDNVLEDTVVINTDFTQDIIPGTTLSYDLGSVSKRWAEIHATNNSTINNLTTESALVSEQTYIGGPTNLITTVQSNEDLVLRPGRGVLYVDDNFLLETTPGSPDNLLHTLDNPNAYGTGSSDYFGYSVDTDGNHAIVGAHLEDDAGGGSSGKAYIFDVATGALLHTLDNPNAYSTSANDYFGFSVAIDGNYAIVGAYLEDDASGNSSGKAYIFDVATGALLHTLDNPNAYSTSGGDYFGYSVDTDGNHAIVGAHLEDDASGNNSGKAYIFDVATGALLHTLDNPNAYSTSTNDYFGFSVAIDGNYAIVGAYLEDDASGNSSGKAYIFNVSTGSLIHTLDNPNAYGTSVSDYFGWSVAISGNYAIVGAYQEDDASGNNSGKAYIFDVATSALVHTLDNPNAYSTSGGDFFGYSVAISDNYAIVGALTEDETTTSLVSNSGKAYVFNIGSYANSPVPTTFEYGRADNSDGTFQVTLPDLSRYDSVTVIIDNINVRGDLSSPSIEYIDLKFSTATTYDRYTGGGDDAIYRPGNGDGIWLGGTPTLSHGGGVSWFNIDYIIPAGVNFSPGLPNSYWWQIELTISIFIVDGITVIDNPSPVTNAYFGRSVAISGSTTIIGAYNNTSTTGGKAHIFGSVNTITNRSSTDPVSLVSTGNGYVNFNGTNGLVIPAGTSAERGFTEIGETRWNTDLGQLECYDGNIYIVATGPGAFITQEVMQDLAFVRSILLG